MADRLLIETSAVDGYLLEDGTGALLLDGAYAVAVLARSPTAYWRLGEASGTSATDISGNGYNGTYTGGTLTLGTIGLLADDSDTAVGFPGADTDYMQSPTLSALGTAFSLAVWIKPDLVSSGIFISANGSEPYLRHLDSDITFAFRDSVNVQRQFATTTDTAPTGTAIFVVGTHNGTTARLYINGVEQATDATASNAVAAVTWRVGRWDVDTLPFDGTLDEVAIFGSALTAAQIADLYAAGRARLPYVNPMPQLLAH